METDINYTAVGAFVIALVMAIVLAIIWLSSGFSLEQNSTYMVYMEESVSGLSVDSTVEYNGVDVGTVKSIELNSKNPQLVEVLLSLKKTTPITHGTTATLTTRGLTGLAYIALKDKSTDLRPLLAEDGQPYPVIPTAPSIFMRLDAALTGVSKDLRQVAQSFSTLLNKENLESFRAILVNMQKLTATMASNDQKLDAIFANTAHASQQFGPLLQSGTLTMHMLQTQTLPMTYQILSNLNEVSRSLSIVSTQIQQNPAVLLRGATRPLGPGETR